MLLDITDNGIGMSAEELAEANWRLDNPPVVDVAVSRRMGLFVVGRLALRHGIRVQLGAPGRRRPDRPGPAAGDAAHRGARRGARRVVRPHGGGRAGVMPYRQGPMPSMPSMPPPPPTPSMPAPVDPFSGHDPHAGAFLVVSSQFTNSVELPPAPFPAQEPVRESTQGDFLPIFASVGSTWFTQAVVHAGPAGVRPDPAWSSSGDSGWQAAGALREPASGGTTSSGLPKRTPKANLVPGSDGARAVAHARAPGVPRSAPQQALQLSAGRPQGSFTELEEDR